MTLPGLALSIRGCVYVTNNPAPTPPDEQPQHKVRITKPFYLGIFTVTQAQYEAVMGVNPSRSKGANRPVEMVSWKDAVEFCKKLSAKTGREVRLPTEAEWEYACRAGTTTPFYTGDRLSYKQASIWPDWIDVDGVKEVPSEKAGPYQHPVSICSYLPQSLGTVRHARPGLAMVPGLV